MRRKVTLLEDLSYTYFTVENIETKSTIEIHLKNPLEKDNTLQLKLVLLMNKSKNFDIGFIGGKSKC